MKKKVIVIDDVDNADSIMDDDGCRRFLVNAISERTSAMSEKTDVPIICLEDDDDIDGLKIDKDYKVFLDHLRDDNNLSSRFGVDNGESNTRKFNIFSADSKRPKLENENPMNKTVSQQRKRNNVGFNAEISRLKIRENIQRDNRVAERRKRRIAELEATRTSTTVPLVKTPQDIQPDNRVRKNSGLKAETLRKAVPLVRTEQGIQRDNLVSDGRTRETDVLKAGTLRRDVPLVRTEEYIQRDNMIAEQRERKTAETKAAETSRVVHVERVNRDTEVKDVDHEPSRNEEVFLGGRKKNEQKSADVVDKDYLCYLTWLVNSLKDSTTKPVANIQKDQSEFDPPISDIPKESTTVHEKDVAVKVKVEQDLESWSDDSDIIAVSDSPFLDGKSNTFVASKKVVDLGEGSKEDESNSSWFRKELMDVLKKPYNEGELKKLHHEASIHRKMTRCRELRKGRESDYETDELGLSYREQFTDFEKEYKPVDGIDKARALKLLRGFFFYLKNVSHDGAFKPWEKNQWWKP